MALFPKASLATRKTFSGRLTDRQAKDRSFDAKTSSVVVVKY